MSFDILDWVNIGNNFATELLVYGKLVNDFHFIKKDKIFAVGIGAIQQVDKLLSSAIDRIAKLEQMVNVINSTLNLPQL